MHTRLMDTATEDNLLSKVEKVAGLASPIANPESSNWLFQEPSAPNEFDVEKMTSLARERFADAKFSPLFMMV